MRRPAQTTMGASLLLASVIFCLSQTGARGDQETALQEVGDNTPITIYSQGAVSCGLWLDARAGKEKNEFDVRQLQMEAYLFGFATAYNLYVEGPLTDGKRNVLHIDEYGQRAFLDEWCRQHATVDFATAVLALLKHLDEAGHR